jgi:hypothetical protein
MMMGFVCAATGRGLTVPERETLGGEIDLIVRESKKAARFCRIDEGSVDMSVSLSWLIFCLLGDLLAMNMERRQLSFEVKPP